MLWHMAGLTKKDSQITRWVAETILAQSDQRKRANTIKHFITIAEVLSLVVVAVLSSMTVSAHRNVGL